MPICRENVWSNLLWKVFILVSTICYYQNTLLHAKMAPRLFTAHPPGLIVKLQEIMAKTTSLHNLLHWLVFASKSLIYEFVLCYKSVIKVEL